MAKYRRPIFTRVPFIKRHTIMTRTPLVTRNPMYSRTPVTSETIEYEGCTIEDCKDCAGKLYCKISATRESDDTNFRLIRVKETLTEEQWNEIIKGITFVRTQGCNIRMVTDVPVPKEVIFELAYSPYNVIQYNVNLFDSDESFREIRSSLTTADNCGLYVCLMLFPIIPVATKSSDILEFLNSMGCSCNMLCFKFIELPSEMKPKMHCFNVNGHILPEEYMELQGNKWVCNQYFKENFCTIMMTFLTPRKISCSLCNDNICY